MFSFLNSRYLFNVLKLQVLILRVADCYAELGLLLYELRKNEKKLSDRHLRLVVSVDERSDRVRKCLEEFGIRLEDEPDDA
jgi:ribosome assembly protein YihI (activator of Der GTPase)